MTKQNTSDNKYSLGKRTFNLEENKSFSQSKIVIERESLSKKELSFILKIAKKRMLQLERSYKKHEKMKMDNVVSQITYLSDLGEWNGIRWVIETLLQPSRFVWGKSN